VKGSENRSLRRFTCTESGKREQPEWVQKVPDQIAEFLANGGTIQQIPMGYSKVNNGLSRKDVHEMRKKLLDDAGD
jgi:hypothetical protein